MQPRVYTGRFFCSIPGTPPPPPPKPETLLSRGKRSFLWLKQTAKEKGKPFIAWYVTLYLGGLVGSYGIVRSYGKVEPEIVMGWAETFKLNKVVNLEELNLTKENCEYLAAVLLNEALDWPRLLLAVLTVDRAIALGRRIVLRKSS
jgi:hypothetical protein